jgi:hypothetical protein
VLRLAAQLTAASDGFRDARLQMWSQTLGAAQRGQDAPWSWRCRRPMPNSRRVASSLDEADALAADGQLLLRRSRTP